MNQKLTYIEPLTYIYGMSLKLSSIPGETKLSELFHNIDNIIVSSKKFDTMELAVHSVSEFVKQVTNSLNIAVGSEKYKQISEINPKISGTETPSQDWVLDELIKVWIIDNDHRNNFPDAPIRAVGLAQLLRVHEEPILAT